MTNAAKSAGIEYVELVYEPQCAAASFLYDIRDRIPRQLNRGDVLLVIDIGGGTGDSVSYEFTQDSGGGAKVGLRMIGHAQGTDFRCRHSVSVETYSYVRSFVRF